MVATTESEWLTTAEAAKTLKVSPLTVSRWIKQGRLPASRVGPRAVRIRREDLTRVMTPIVEPVGTMAEATSTGMSADSPISEELKARRLAALEGMRINSDAILARRGGVPFESSADLIREGRDEGTW